MPNQGILFGRDARPSANARMAQTVGRQTLPLQIQPTAAVHRAYVRIRRHERNMARIKPAHAGRHTRIRPILREPWHRTRAVSLHIRTPICGHAHAGTARTRRIPRRRRPAVQLHRTHEAPHTQRRRRSSLRVLHATGRLVSATFPFEAIQHLRRRNLRPRQRQVEAGSATCGRRNAVRNIRGQTLRTPV